MTADQTLLERYPEYAQTASLDELRAREYSRLDATGHAYLDYTGGGLYAECQISEHNRLLRDGIYGNPHSRNPTSQATTDLVESARAKVLDFFHASPDEYVAIFTANASSALKLVGESYPFAAGDHYLLTFDNHNSVNGIREYARARQAEISYVPVSLPEMRVDPAALEQQWKLARAGGHNLFAYPAQSNFSGVQHPLAWVAQAQAAGWDVLLDAAAFVATNRLDLSACHPDYVTLSFYKMFGYPTGVGCLLARREALRKLHRPWFAGGTITVASVQGDRYFMADGASGFEDGTLDYLSIPGVEIGLSHLERVGLETIHLRCRCLTAWLIEELLLLRHSAGQPLVRLYGPANTESRGGTLTMNFYDARGRVIDHRLVEESANRHNISLRTGCFCNPGGGEVALELSRTELLGCFNQPIVEETQSFTVDDFRLCIDGKETGAVRVSMGVASNFEDVRRFAEFAREILAASVLSTN